ncbi:hypothetical protein PG999_014044 [Apiospora kogelbergensis]|uniref:NACHT domain-containing protein n=1 Tax=Apiospora kogelbergensis TaxID=1337665 RepID=A0AAW0Q8L6_9PEZI
MDPLSGLGVASNILAVIDFGWTLLTEARSIHKSSSGLSGEAEFVDHLVRDVAILDAKLPSLVDVSGELQRLLGESKKITDLLQKALEALKARDNRSKWNSVLSALKQSWGRDEVKDLTGRLSSLQVQVTGHIQRATHHEVTRGMTRISQAIAQIESTNARLEIKRRDDLRKLQENLIRAIEESKTSGRDIETKVNNLPDETKRSKKGKERTQEEIQRENQEFEVKRNRITTKLASFRELEVATRAISESVEAARADQLILDRLRFDNIQARHRKIEKAHAKTFQWVFEEQTRGPRLREWLETRNDVFWVYGKPGSGKSTFMKFLCGSRDTSSCLRRWAGEKLLVVAKFFFWNAGTTLQKSQEGLLRSLLFEILRQCPELMPAVKSAISEIPDWTGPDAFRYAPNLLLLYQTIATQDIPIKFCFFIDGLDEYEEERRGHSDLIKVLRQLDSSPDIKLCVSSRPWTVFADEFGSNADWTIKLEDLTRDDIQRYVSDKFNEHPQFQTLTQMNSEYSQVVDAVVNRAQGVFLWVYLVVRTLLEGLTYHDSVSTLYQRLHEFPPDLELFFQHLIDSISPIYRKMMARYFRIATIADIPMSAIMYSFLDDIDDNSDFALSLEQSELDPAKIRLRKDQLRRRLDARSRGLLELVQDRTDRGTDDKTVHFFGYRVDFLHRTVRDFLHQSADVSSSLQDRLGSENIPLTACHAILSALKTAPLYDRSHPRHYLFLIEDLFFFAAAALAERPDSNKTLEPVLDAAESSYRLNADCLGADSKPFLFIGLAAQIDYSAYVHKMLRASPNMLQESQNNNKVAPVRPAIDFALQSARYTRPISTRSVTYLLEAGADPNMFIDGGTVWTGFLDSLYGNWTAGKYGFSNDDEMFDKDRACELIRLLLLHGADTDAEIQLSYRSERSKLSVNAKELIGEIFTPDVASELYQGIHSRSDQMTGVRLTSKDEQKPRKKWYKLFSRRIHK